MSDWQFTISEAIQWRVVESRKPGARPLGDSLRYTTARLQREPIGAKVIGDLKPGDLVDYCRSRIAGGVKPCTVNHDLTTLRSTLRDFIESNDLPHEWLLVFTKTRRLLDKAQLIGKSEPRTRLPEEAELALRKAHFEKQNQHPNCITDMVLVEEALTVCGRRISELTRIERQHVNVEKKTCWIYNLKNSKGKGYHAEFALLGRAWEIFEDRLRVIPQEPTAFLFPFNPKTCSQRSTKANKALGIKGLRMHDDRAKCFVELMDKGYSVVQVQKGVSLHKDIKTLVGTYTRIRAEDLHKGPQGMPRLTPR